MEDSDYSLVSQEEEAEEVLKETCPQEYQSVTEEDVSCERDIGGRDFWLIIV